MSLCLHRRTVQEKRPLLKQSVSRFPPTALAQRGTSAGVKGGTHESKAGFPACSNFPSVNEMPAAQHTFMHAHAHTYAHPTSLSGPQPRSSFPFEGNQLQCCGLKQKLVFETRDGLGSSIGWGWGREWGQEQRQEQIKGYEVGDVGKRKKSQSP